MKLSSEQVCQDESSQPKLTSRFAFFAPFTHHLSLPRETDVHYTPSLLLTDQALKGKGRPSGPTEIDESKRYFTL